MKVPDGEVLIKLCSGEGEAAYCVALYGELLLPDKGTIQVLP